MRTQKARLRVAAAVGLALVLVGAACQPAGPFARTTDMHAPRAGHTATLLPSGRVLVVGGAAAGRPSVERWDPASGSWLVRAEMLTPRSGHVATRLSSGKVLVTGGRSTASGALLTSAEVYDPATDRWTSAAATPHPGGHSAALLSTGEVLAVFADERGRGWLYDPVADAWSPTGPKLTRAWRTTSSLSGGGAVVVGGDTVNATETTEGSSRAERYDASLDAWFPAATLAGMLPRQEVELFWTGEILVTGPSLNRRGSYAETAIRAALYDPSADRWRAAADVVGCQNLDPSLAMTLTLYDQDDELSWLVVGRGECAGTTYSLAVESEVGKPESEQLPGFAERERHAAVRLQDGRVLITGGAFAVSDGSCCPPLEVRATAELFTP